MQDNNTLAHMKNLSQNEGKVQIRLTVLFQLNVVSAGIL